jgi:DUF438 domain-containing protein
MSETIENSEQRKTALKGLIRKLHEGRSVQEVKAEFAQLLEDVGASEIAEIEEALIAEGLPETEVKRLCDVHVAVFRESLDAQPLPASTPGHPVHTFRAENEAVDVVLSELEGAAEALDGGPAAWSRAQTLLQMLTEYDRHYLRKENILFPYLESQGFSGPSSVMWSIHDDVRSAWKDLEELLAAGPGDDPPTTSAQVRDKLDSLAKMVRDMVYKEENILFPAAMERLSEREWRSVREQGPELGYAYVTPGDEWPPQELQDAPPSSSMLRDLPRATTGSIRLQTGALAPKEIDLLLNHLPVDITYVDAKDTVRFFSHGQDRVFPRTPAVIGRRVQMCHPPQSVHRVQQILDEFRAGTRDEAEFWLQHHGRFIHIRYFALRDSTDTYQGTLEVVQDLTPLRALEGEKRLLERES